MTSLITVPRLDNLGDTLLYFAAGDQHIPILLLEDLKKGKQSSIRKGNVYLGCINLSIPILIDEVENEKLGICLYLNGSSKDEQVRGIRWHFVDMDEGAKQEQWSRIQKAKLQPTMIYEGRAGYKLLYKIKEAYWDVSTPDTIAKSIAHFKNVQQQLVEFFGADGSVINPSNALRSPFASNYKEYPERVVMETIVFFDPQNEYSQTEIIEAFPPVHKKHFVRKPISSRYSETESEQIISMFISNLEMEGKEFVDYGDRLIKLNLTDINPDNESEDLDAVMPNLTDVNLVGIHKDEINNKYTFSFVAPCIVNGKRLDVSTRSFKKIFFTHCVVSSDSYDCKVIFNPTANLEHVNGMVKNKRSDWSSIADMFFEILKTYIGDIKITAPLWIPKALSRFVEEATRHNNPIITEHSFNLQDKIVNFASDLLAEAGLDPIKDSAMQMKLVQDIQVSFEAQLVEKYGVILEDTENFEIFRQRSDGLTHTIDVESRAQSLLGSAAQAAKRSRGDGDIEL